MTTAIATTALRLGDPAGLSRRPSSRSIGLRLLGPLAAVMALGVLTPPRECRADLEISVQDSSAAAGSSGQFLVLLKDTDPSGSPSYNVEGDSFELTLSGGSGVSFTGISIPGPGFTPYIYAVSTVDQMSFPLYTNLTTTDLTAADTGYYISGGYPGYTTVNPGDVYALGLVSYSVAPGVAPGTMVSVNLASGSSTSLSDNNSASILFETADGSITVTSTATPEPSSALVVMSTLGILLLVQLRRRRAPATGQAA